MYNVWDVSEYYGGKLDFPADFTLSAEAGNEVTALSGDLSTYYAENYNAFFDGSRPLSEWDDYIASLMEMGLERVYEIYQVELDAYYSAQ
jgi:putative aldouronate transport system substrate-binding protein